MLAKHFSVIIQSEENTIAFLKEKGLIEIMEENLLVYQGKIHCCRKKRQTDIARINSK